MAVVFGNVFLMSIILECKQ